MTTEKVIHNRTAAEVFLSLQQTADDARAGREVECTKTEEQIQREILIVHFVDHLMETAMAEATERYDLRPQQFIPLALVMLGVMARNAGVPRDHTWPIDVFYGGFDTAIPVGLIQ